MNHLPVDRCALVNGYRWFGLRSHECCANFAETQRVRGRQVSPEPRCRSARVGRQMAAKPSAATSHIERWLMRYPDSGELKVALEGAFARFRLPPPL